MLASMETAYLQSINALIEKRLKPVVEHNGLIGWGEKDLNLASRHLCISDNSKRARPLLCLYFHWLFNETYGEDFAHVGVAAEFIHAASLLHDDIIDEAEQRRGKTAVNRVFGNAKAVLAGDFLLTEAFELLRGFDRDLIDQAIVVVREMTKAAMMELNTRGRIDLDPASLRRICVGKTGALFAWCGFAAARCGKFPDHAEHLWEIGEHIGFIFQLADDIKDFDGDHNLKDVCRDIRNRELSLPILLACDESASLRADFADAFSHDEISADIALQLKDKIMATRGVEKAKAVMRAELDFVISALARYEGSRGQKALERFISGLLKTN